MTGKTVNTGRTGEGAATAPGTIAAQNVREAFRVRAVSAAYRGLFNLPPVPLSGGTLSLHTHRPATAGPTYRVVSWEFEDHDEALAAYQWLARVSAL